MKKSVMVLIGFFLLLGWTAAEDPSGEEFYRLMRRELQRYSWGSEEMDAMEGELASLNWEGLSEADPELIAFSLELAKREMRQLEEPFQEKYKEAVQTMHRLQARIAREMAGTALELRNMGVEQRLVVRSVQEGTRRAAQDVAEKMRGLLEYAEEGASFEGGEPGEDPVRDRLQLENSLTERLRTRIGEAQEECEEQIRVRVREQLRLSFDESGESPGNPGGSGDDSGGANAPGPGSPNPGQGGGGAN